MQRVWTFERTAVVVMPWHEPMSPPERGARVEVRLLAREEQRGSRAASQRIVLDRPVCRYDLFDTTDAPPGNLNAAHFHPQFSGDEPGERVFDEGLRADVCGWLAQDLSDLEGVVARSGVDVEAREVAADADALRLVVDEVIAAVEATWADVRSAS